MASALLRACRYPGCPKTIRSGRFCDAHQSAAPVERGNTTVRRYGWDWQKLRKRFLMSHPVCGSPGCGRAATDVDHIVPRASGGSDDDDNLQALCHECHSRKTATHDGGFGRGRKQQTAKQP